MYIRLLTGKLVIIVLFIVFVIVFFYSSHNSLSYDEKTTHPALTDEIADFYNLSFSNKLLQEEKEWIVHGSINEDLPPRWINHFYDPIYKNGWTGDYAGVWSTSTIKSLSAILSTKDPVSSLNWLHNELLQIKYSNYGGNNTWENAIRQYTKGNKREAYQILGHILHLLEDATVPDHTRNDTHAHELEGATGDYGSPYEEYLKKYTRQTIKELDIANNFKKANLSPISKLSIEDYLISLAEYSNKYFFSKDTINNPKYQLPKIIRTDGNFGYGRDENGREFMLARVKRLVADNGDIIINYVIDIRDEFILDSYFSRLSRQAVLNGAGVIKLFHDEVGRVMQNPDLIPPEPQLSWWQAEMRSTYYGSVAVYNSAGSVLSTTAAAISYGAAVAYNSASFAVLTTVSTISSVANAATRAVLNAGSFFRSLIGGSTTNLIAGQFTTVVPVTTPEPSVAERSAVSAASPPG